MDPEVQGSGVQEGGLQGGCEWGISVDPMGPGPQWTQEAQISSRSIEIQRIKGTAGPNGHLRMQGSRGPRVQAPSTFNGQKISEDAWAQGSMTQVSGPLCLGLVVLRNRFTGAVQGFCRSRVAELSQIQRLQSSS